MTSLENQTFQYYTDLNSPTLLTLPFPEAIENLYARKNKMGSSDPILGIPIFEWISRTTEFTKYFFDLDIPDPNWKPDWDILADLVECFSIPADKVASICFTPSTTKRSNHITLHYIGKRADIKAAAAKLGFFLSHKYADFKPEYVDLAVYGASQKWRCIYSSKRGEARIKQPLLGDVEEALVTYIPKPHFFMPNTFPATIFRPPAVSLSKRLKWFKSALEEPTLAALWADRRASYEGWVTVGQTLHVECREHPHLYNEILGLYQQFSQNSNRAEVEEKFRTAFVTSQRNLWNQVHKWVKDFNATTATLLDRIWTGSVDRIISDLDMRLPETNISTGELALEEAEPLMFATRTEFLIYYQITHSEKLFRLWHKNLKDADYSSLLLLLASDPLKVTYLEKMAASKNIIGEVSPDMTPYGEIVLCDKPFFEWIGAKLGCPPPSAEKTEISNEAKQTAFQSYIRLCKTIDQEITEQALQISVPVTPMGTREYRNPAEIIRMIIDKDACYLMQYPYQDFLRELFQACESKYDLFWLAFSKFSKHWLIIETLFHFICNCPDEGTAAEVIIALYPYWRQSPNGEIYVYDDTEGLWSTRDSIKQSVISRFSSLLVYQPLKGNPFNHALSHSKRDNIRKFIETSDSIRDNGSRAFKETQGSGFYKLLFRNGYYDGLAEAFFPKQTITIRNHSETFFGHFSTVFFSRIDNDWREIDEDGIAKTEEIAEKTYYRMFGHDLGEYILSLYALILMGAPFKGFLEFLGSTNSGKSTAITFLKKSFDGYIADGQTENFVVKSTDFRAIDRQYAWIVDHWPKRLMLFSEGGDKDAVFSSNRIKKVASGRTDIIQASKLRENAEGYEVHFICAFFLNYELKWDNPKDPALIDRQNLFTYHKVCVNEVTDPETQILKDPSVVAWESNKAYQLAYNHLIIAQWLRLKQAGYKLGTTLPRPGVLDAMDTDRQLVAPTTAETIEEMLQWLIITGNEEHHIEVADLKNVFEEHLAGLPQKMLKMLEDFLRGYGITLKKVQKRVAGGRKPYVYLGIKERSTRAQEYSMLADFKHWQELLKEEGGQLSSKAIAALEKTETISQSTGPLNPEERLYVEKWASSTQINYLQTHNTFFSNKRPRVENDLGAR